MIAQFTFRNIARAAPGLLMACVATEPYDSAVTCKTEPAANVVEPKAALSAEPKSGCTADEADVQPAPVASAKGPAKPGVTAAIIVDPTPAPLAVLPVDGHGTTTDGAQDQAQTTTSDDPAASAVSAGPDMTSASASGAGRAGAAAAGGFGANSAAAGPEGASASSADGAGGTSASSTLNGRTYSVSAGPNGVNVTAVD